MREITIKPVLYDGISGWNRYLCEFCALLLSVPRRTEILSVVNCRKDKATGKYQWYQQASADSEPVHVDIVRLMLSFSSVV